MGDAWDTWQSEHLASTSRRRDIALIFRDWELIGVDVGAVDIVKSGADYLDVVLIDEVGYENLSSEQAALFFQLINTRYEHGSIILTSNKPFGKWGEIMADDAVATATLDRLLHHSHVISLKGDSYRMKDRI